MKKKRLTITVLVDNQKSWFVSYGRELIRRIKRLGHRASLVFRIGRIKKGEPKASVIITIRSYG